MRRDLLEAVLDPGEGPQAPSARRRARSRAPGRSPPPPSRCGGCAGRAGAISSTASSGSSSHHSCPARSESSACGPSPKHTRRAQPPRSSIPEPERRDGDVVVALVGEDAQLGRAVGLEGPVAVEVVGRQVEQHGALGRELDGVLELEGGDLADHGRRRAQPADERAQRRADVAGDRHRPPGLAVDVADELGRRRLAVGPGDRDELVGDQPPGELDLAQDREPALARGGDDRRLRGHARAT